MLANEALQHRIADNINRTVSSAEAEPSLDEAIRSLADQTAADPLFCQALRGGSPILYRDMEYSY